MSCPVVWVALQDFPVASSGGRRLLFSLSVKSPDVPEAWVRRGFRLQTVEASFIVRRVLIEQQFDQSEAGFGCVDGLCLSE